MSRARATFADPAEIDEFVATLERFERGEITAEAWRAFRLVRGTYAQRQEGDAQMLRVKIPQGVLGRPQLLALADVALRHSRGFCHVTTRQNVQFHFLRLHDVEPALRRLAEAGLTTREACGNSVRNVTACPYAGVAAEEAFDVTPYAEALTRHLLRHPLSSALPRKFKIAFEGCPEDHALAAINDVGFHARLRTDEAGAPRRGFRVTAGGGTSILCRSGEVLLEFLPAGGVLEVAEAIVRVYHRRGDYAHRQRNRLKFLIRDMGFPSWRAAFEQAYAEVRAAGGLALPFEPDRPPVEEPPAARAGRSPSPGEARARAAAGTVRGPGVTPRPSLPVSHPGFERWAATNCRPQKQPRFQMVTVRLPLGDVTAAQLRVLADVADAFADGALRTTHEQDLALRWVPERSLRRLHAVLAAAGLGEPGGAANVTSCPGAEACRLAVTQSRGAGRLLFDRLRQLEDAPATGAAVKISGCPNGCGHHHVAAIGLQGSVRRLGSRVVPQYFVFVGGGCGPEGARFGALAAKVPARRVADAVERLLALHAAEGAPGETLAAFLRRADLARVKAALADLEAIGPDDARPEDFVDLGEEAEFTLAAMEGECSA